MSELVKDVINWPERVRTIVEAARALVRTADEFQPEDVAEGEPWAGGEDLERVDGAISAMIVGEALPLALQCRGCLAVAPSELVRELDAAGWWYTPPSISPDGPDLYCPECRTLLREAIR